MENIKVGLKGAFTLTLKKEDGTVEVMHKDNIIVDGGFDLIADSLGNAGARPAVLSHIAIGTGSEAAAAGNTALGAESARQAISLYTHTPGTKVFTLESSFTGLTAAITEAGLFNGNPGTMFDRVVFLPINLATNDTLTAKFTLTMS